MTSNERHRVFVSYHHARDQGYREALRDLNRRYEIFLDWSVDTGDIDETLDDQSIRRKIRDEYLQDSSVTIVLVGLETSRRKHIDWEIYSSMYDGAVNKQSGILAINLPSTGTTDCWAAHGEAEKRSVYPEMETWYGVPARADLERIHPYLPERIIDNILTGRSRISVVPWGKIANSPSILGLLIDVTCEDRALNEYDLSRPMRRSNS
ncbi:TIR domain-containing protein [Usitatibacter rugosus]|uniref:TIR domain-containing protein n=1 Tax=Usitatibacter rugosus TaxID=2732067 RepID=UPI001488ED16